MRRSGELIGYVVVNTWFWPNPVVCGQGSEIYITYREACQELKEARGEARDGNIRMMLVVEPRKGKRHTL